MPITSVAGKITESPPLNYDRQLRTGVVSDIDFVICDEVDILKQAKFQVSGVTSGQTRVITIPDADTTIGAIPNQVIQYSAPLTGVTVAIAAATSVLLVEPAGTLAALTLTFPSVGAADDGKVIRFSCTQIVTALTITPLSGSIVNALTTIAANGFASFVYRHANTSWYRIG